jgi:tetratricopeptide (TPR) repeat protein
VTNDVTEILAKYNVTYLVVPADRESISQFDLLSGYFVPLYRNQSFALFRVNLPPEGNALVRANTLYTAGDLQGAIDQYNLALSQNLNGSLAHTGLGMVLQVLDKPRLAAQELEEAVRIAPNNVQAHYHLAIIYRKMGMNQQADIHASAAGPLKEPAQ